MAREKRRKPAAAKAGRPTRSRARAEREQPSEENEVVLGPVPRKKGKLQSVRLTSHKARSRWFQARTSWPVREAAVTKLVRERARAEKALAAPANVTSEWESVGPTNIGGRITSLACHTKHP
jgi:hypothetical protein